MKTKANHKASAPGWGFAAQEILGAAENLVAQEALRGERLGYQMRWVFMLAGLAILALNLWAGRQVMGSRWGLALVFFGLAYNYWLGLRLRQGQAPLWTSYLAVTLDILLVVGYSVLVGLYTSPTAVATSPALMILPVILLFVALRHNPGLLAYAVVLTVVSTSLTYYLFLPQISRELMSQAVGLDPFGVLVRQLFLALFGVSLFFLPATIKRLIGQQQSLYEERQAAELRHRLSLEAQVHSRTAELVRANQELQKALDEVKTLSGLLPICANCKKIRDDGGYWRGVEDYLCSHSQAEFTHAICPDCMARLYPDLYENFKDKL